MLFYAARADHLQQTIAPQLAAGGWVVCDRFSDSTRVYQGSRGGVAPEVLEALEDLVVKDHRPDLTVVLDLEPRDGLAPGHAPARADARGRPMPIGSSRASSPFTSGYAPATWRWPRRSRSAASSLTQRWPPETIAAAVWQVVVERLLAGATDGPRTGAAGGRGSTRGRPARGLPASARNAALFGHAAAERTLAQAFASGQMHHAWLLTGRRASARRHWPIDWRGMPWLEPRSVIRAARGSRSAPTTRAARQVNALSHPGLLLLRRPYDSRARRFASGDPG